jgi:hypothetical protein
MEGGDVHVGSESDGFVGKSGERNLKHGASAFEDLDGEDVAGARGEEFGEFGVKHEAIRGKVQGIELAVDGTAQFSFGRQSEHSDAARAVAQAQAGWDFAEGFDTKDSGELREFETHLGRTRFLENNGDIFALDGVEWRRGDR